ncbi:hypothetical protein ES702_00145 [subsurface metagenome]
MFSVHVQPSVLPRRRWCRCIPLSWLVSDALPPLGPHVQTWQASLLVTDMSHCEKYRASAITSMYFSRPELWQASGSHWPGTMSVVHPAGKSSISTHGASPIRKLKLHMCPLAKLPSDVCGSRQVQFASMHATRVPALFIPTGDEQYLSCLRPICCPVSFLLLSSQAHS